MAKLRAPHVTVSELGTNRYPFAAERICRPAETAMGYEQRYFHLCASFYVCTLNYKNGEVVWPGFHHSRAGRFQR